MKLLAASLILMSIAAPVFASGTDADIAGIKAHDKAMQVSDARYKAKQEETRRATAAAKKTQDAQTAAAVRPMLGKTAEGKSDAEVVRMYEAKVAQDDKKGPPDEAAIRAQSEATTQGMTGKSVQDMQNMSDEDMDKMEADLKKKYGQ